VIANIKQQLIDAGAVYAAMSGSGSTVFGLFDSKVQTEKLRSITDYIYEL
jgi:4-diphosphocytidyl-2-C-methyl-D-erythritol kinase